MHIALDGKTICSTTKLSSVQSPLHIISAQVSELGLTLAQCGVADKCNEISAVQALLKELNKKAISKIMLDCLLDVHTILSVIAKIDFRAF